jgi:hypothetical protein
MSQQGKKYPVFLFLVLFIMLALLILARVVANYSVLSLEELESERKKGTGNIIGGGRMGLIQNQYSTERKEHFRKSAESLSKLLRQEYSRTAQRGAAAPEQ